MEIRVSDNLKKLAEMSKTPVFIVGGYVRNILAGLGKTDIDLAGPNIATNLNIESMARINVVNFKLGTAVIKSEGNEYEYTPFRVEKYGDGGAHSPVDVYFTQDIKLDALRRDFTCNSVYFDIINNKFVDPLNGVADIGKKIVKALYPAKVFSSDGLRLMRLVRIAVETGFKIESETANYAKANAHLLADISPERKRAELMRILVADTKYNVAGAHYRGMRLLYQLGLWEYLIPELLRGQGLNQNPQYHKYDVLEHAFQAVRFSPPEVRLAALLHDIGKPYCFESFGNMHGHEKAGEIMTREILGPAGLRFSGDEIDETANLVKNHMYDMTGNAKEPKIKLFIAENYPQIDKLVKLIDADKRATGFVEGELPRHRFLVIKEKMEKENTPFNLGDLKINGNDVLAMGIQGTEIGEVLKDLHRSCIIDPSLNNPAWLSERVSNIALKNVKVET